MRGAGAEVRVGWLARGAAGLSAEHRQTAVVVHGVETELSLVQRFGVPTQGQTELAGIAGFAVGQTVQLAIDGAKAHVFDRASGARLG